MIFVTAISEIVFRLCIMQNDNFAHNSAQHCAIKFCVKLEELASVIFEKLKQAYGKHSLSRAQVFCWHKSILKGREHIEDEHHSGRP